MLARIAGKHGWWYGLVVAILLAGGVVAALTLWSTPPTRGEVIVILLISVAHGVAFVRQCRTLYRRALQAHAQRTEQKRQ